MSVVPVLDSRADMLSCDWPDAEYRCEMTQLSGGERIKATHYLDGADALSELVQREKAQFAVEIVSPATLTTSLKLAPEGERHHTFELGAEIDNDGAQARPGLITVTDCVVPVGQLNTVWQGHSGIAVLKGQWLARGQHSDLVSPRTGLLRFIADPSMDRYQMSCQHIHPFYEVRMNKDALAELRNNEAQPAAKTIILAAYVAALADANHQTAFTGDDGDDTKEAVGYQLHEQIKALDPTCPAPGEDDYDPLRAATVLIGSDMIVFESESGSS